MVWNFLLEAQDINNNIITIGSFLCCIIPPKLSKLSLFKKAMCVFKGCIYENSMHLYLFDRRKKHLKCLDPNYLWPTSLSYVENIGKLFSQYRDEVITDGKILHEKAMRAKYGTMCPFSIRDIEIPHWKCVISCFLNCTNATISYE